MMGSKALDLFCGAGGASMGLHRAGFDVTGIDIRPQPRYPFRFIQADAMEFQLDGYDLIWASPPCQAHSSASAMQKSGGKSYVSLIAETRIRLADTGSLWIIENVPGSPLRPGSLRLCGLAFGLPLLRHRYFESPALMIAPPHVRHVRGMAMRGEVFTVAGNPGCRSDGRLYKNGGRGGGGGSEGGGYPLANREQACRALGIDWMTRKEMSQAVPPAYAEFIGKQALTVLDSATRGE